MVVGEVSNALHPSGNGSLQIVSTHVRGDADDGAPAIVVVQLNVFAYGVLIGPKTASGFRGDNGDWLAGDIGVSKRSSADDGDTHHPKIFGSDDVKPEEWRLILPGVRRVVLKVERALGDSAAEGKRIHESDGVDAWRSAHLVQQGAVEGQAAFRIAAKRLIGRNPGGEDMCGAEARVHMRKRPEAADQQTSSSHKKRRKGDFSDNQTPAQTSRKRKSASAPAGAKRFHRSRPQGLQNRRQAGKQTGQNREPASESKNAPINVCVSHRKHSLQSGKSLCGERKSQKTAEEEQE